MIRLSWNVQLNDLDILSTQFDRGFERDSVSRPGSLFAHCNYHISFHIDVHKLYLL